MVNLAYYQELMTGLRNAIAGARFAEFCALAKAGWQRGDIPPR
jgi:queuine tRNA-ribosyltransferase